MRARVEPGMDELVRVLRHALDEYLFVALIRPAGRHLIASPRTVKLFMVQADLYGVACFIACA